jgi:hypothetical protein
MTNQIPFKKASVNGKPALVEPQTRKFAALPNFYRYEENDCGSVVGAVDYKGEAIPLFWQSISERDRVHLEQDLTVGE